MSDVLPPLTDALKPAPKRRGRKPGGGKVPGSGRKPGVKNKIAHDMKSIILTRGKPLELLCDISRGVKVRVGPQAGPGEPQYTYPTLQERAAAAKILVDKLIPAAVSKPGDEPAEKAPEEMGDIELARRIAWVLTSADRQLSKRAPDAALRSDDQVLDLKATPVEPVPAPAAEKPSWYNNDHQPSPPSPLASTYTPPADVALSERQSGLERKYPQVVTRRP